MVTSRHTSIGPQTGHSAAGMPLAPPLDGSDEIAQLDRVIHQTAIALGGVVGADLLKSLTLARYERAHRGTVYRVEDPPGTEAGLGWLSEGG